MHLLSGLTGSWDRSSVCLATFGRKYNSLEHTGWRSAALDSSFPSSLYLCLFSNRTLVILFCSASIFIHTPLSVWMSAQLTPSGQIKMMSQLVYQQTNYNTPLWASVGDLWKWVSKYTSSMFLHVSHHHIITVTSISINNNILLTACQMNVLIVFSMWTLSSIAFESQHFQYRSVSISPPQSFIWLKKNVCTVS